jgi:hypothetical protein
MQCPIVPDAFAEHAHQAGFANAGFAAYEDYLAQPVATVRPALPQASSAGELAG